MAKRKESKLTKRQRAHILRTLRKTGHSAPRGASMAHLKRLYKLATGTNPPTTRSFDKRR